MIHQEICSGNEQVLRDIQTVAGKPDTWRPKDPHEVTGEILHTCFMGSKNSGSETRKRAQNLSKAIGSYHLNVEIDTIVNAFTSLFTATFLGRRLKFKSEGGSNQENLALASKFLDCFTLNLPASRVARYFSSWKSVILNLNHFKDKLTA